MRKSTIWLLAVVMAFAFAGLLYLQVFYVSEILKTRNEQFDATVMQCLQQVSKSLEREEAEKALMDDIKNNELRYDEGSNIQITDSNGKSTYIERSKVYKNNQIGIDGINKSTGHNIVTASRDLQNALRERYKYQNGVVREVLEKLLNTPNLVPIQDRIDFKKLNNYLKQEFINSGLNLPFIFSVINKDGNIVFQSDNIKQSVAAEVRTSPLFPNDPPSKRSYLKVYFPTKNSYIFSNIEFIAPSIGFTLVLLVTFIFTIYIVFRQKKLSEMKNDFINNMTHELKTPVSTISLAAQMLKDTDIAKSPEVFKHITGVINDETKRLGFLVEKVLQMSLFERQKASLKLKELDANDLLATIANTFTIKVEKYGGSIDIDLNAIDSSIYVDEMHFTNVLFNLMDNAVKYRRPDVPLKLMCRTWNENGKLMLSIEDNGVGIKKEYLKKVFDRFFRVPTGNVHDVKGFGLGLAYVRKIIEDLSGSIRAESEINNGTKFIISLPLIKS